MNRNCESAETEIESEWGQQRNRGAELHGGARIPW